MKDYTSLNDSELASWGNNFTKKIAENAAKWEIPVSEVTKLRTAINTFSELQKKADSPENTSGEKNVARDVFISLARKMVIFRLNNPVITNEQRVAMGLPQKPLQTVYTQAGYSSLKSKKKK
jgi:hypothetical protein